MKRICVYCGSSPGRRVEYKEAAVKLGNELVERNLGLVYGGASVGIMGEIASTVLDRGGHVTGVIPQALAEKEVSHHGLSELKVVASMHERKALMANMADGFIALAGGFGTLEELFEVLTWSQLGFHKKPCALLNTERYFDHLVSFMNHAVDQQFVKSGHRDTLLIENSPVNLLDAMQQYQPSSGEKWHRAGE